MDFRNQSCSWSFHYKNNPLHLYRPIISYRVTDHGPFFKQESFSLSSVLPKKPLCKLVNMHYKEWKSLAPSIFSYICCVFLGRGFFFIPFLLGWERYTCIVHIADLVCQCLVFWVLNYNAKIYLLLRALVESLFTFYNAHLSKLLLLPFTLNN